MNLNDIPPVNFKRNALHPDEQFKYVLLTEEYADRVVEVFANAFCYSEPMTAYLKMDVARFKIFAEAVVKQAIIDGYSVIALDKEKVIACALVEDLAQPGDIPEFDPKFKYILALLEHLGAHYFVDKHFAQKQVAHLFITAVDADYRHRGLSAQVNFRAMDLAAYKGFSFMYSELTHFFNEKGTIYHLKNNKIMVGSETYNTFVVEGLKPFEFLAGGAHSYLWEIRKNALLNYKKDNQVITETW